MRARVGPILTICLAVGLEIVWAHPIAFQRLPETAGAKRTAGYLASFEERLRKTDELILDGRPKKAYATVTGLIEDMTNRIVGGTQVGQILGVATVLRAIAAHQLGRTDEAAWHWEVASQIFPGVAEFDLTVYEDAGLFMKSLATRERRPEEEEDYPEGITPPRKKRAPKPVFPAAKRGIGQVSVVVEAIIGKDGRPRRPVIVDSKGELTLVCATLDALRRWEFKPAEKDGEPVAVFLHLEVNFASGG